MNKKLLLGIVLVFLGACSYGVLATLVKLAYKEGFSFNEVTSSQYLTGFLVLSILSFFFKDKTKKTQKNKNKSILQLIAAGTSLGLTGIFYYLSLRYIPVSIAIIMLIQSTWLGVLAEAILKKRLPSIKKMIVSLTICGATILAAGIFDQTVEFHFIGFLLGFLAAISYTVTIIASANIGLEMHSIHRSFWLSMGGTIIVLIVTATQWNGVYNVEIFYKWGLLLALFGTILPPILFAYGMPYTGIGLGTILGAIELPVSVLFASVLLHENLDPLRWTGVLIILTSILVMNINKNKKKHDI